jgi:NAD(P)-dependent dehydrogenase (short-subunit alcohol dehydrogenase family)
MNGSAGRKVVVVTGASAGVGRATVREFASHGYCVGLIARETEGLQAAAEEARSRGVSAVSAPADVADAEAVERAAEKIERELGPIDVWVNVAMTTVYAPLAEITPAEYKRATEVTYLGYVYGTMAALRRMRPRNRGTIVQVGSALSYRAIPLQSPYCGAKFAIRGFTDSLRSELLHDGSNIHITMVQMPALNTPQFDWGRNKLPMRPQPVPPIYQPEVAARAIFFAAHARQREVWVGASTFKAILANKIAPWPLDSYLARAGYTAQLSSEPARKNAPDNLFKPVEGDFGAHGRFDDEALASTGMRTPILPSLALLSAGFLGLAYLLLPRRERSPARRPRRALGRPYSFSLPGTHAEGRR